MNNKFLAVVTTPPYIYHTQYLNIKQGLVHFIYQIYLFCYQLQGGHGWSDMYPPLREYIIYKRDEYNTCLFSWNLLEPFFKVNSRIWFQGIYYLLYFYCINDPFYDPDTLFAVMTKVDFWDEKLYYNKFYKDDSQLQYIANQIPKLPFYTCPWKFIILLYI